MIKKTKRYVAMLAAATMFFGSFSNVQAAKKTFNDPYSIAQDYLDFTGVTTVLGEKHTKTESVKVAIHDGAFDINQEDLVNMWVQDKTVLDSIVGTSTNSGHGTVCSSMISAESDNGKGIAGISNNIKIYPLAFTTKYSTYDFAKLEHAIAYCMKNGIQIISCSYATQNDDTEFINAIREYESWGGIIVCSAGNSGVDNERTDNNGYNNYGEPISSNEVLQAHIGRLKQKYGINNIIEVTSTYDKEYNLGANYGKEETNIGAPGKYVFCPNNMYFPDGTYKKYEDTYAECGGTSLAAPYVAGVCALLKSYYPQATMLQIKSAILSGAEKRASLRNRCSSGGMINAEMAMKELQKTLGCVVEEGEYYIKNKKTGNYLTTSSTANNANVATSDFAGNNRQKWKVEYTKQGQYVFLPRVNQYRTLDVYNNGYSVAGTNVAQCDYSENTNQRWKLKKTATNTYKIITAGNSNYALKATTTATRGSTTVSKDTLALATLADADEWTFEKVDDLYQGEYYINIGKEYMKYSSSAAGGTLTGVDYKANSNQKWTFVYRGNDIYSIHPNGNTAVALELKTGNTSDETIPELASYSGTSSRQRWKILSKSDWTKRIYSTMTSTKCLTLDSSTKISNSLQSSSNKNQEITIEPVNTIYEGTYFMRNSSKNLYATTKSSENAQYVDMSSTTQTNNSKWNFKYLGNGQYQIIPYVNTNLRLDVFNGAPHDNWAAWQVADNGTAAQLWGINKNDDETVTIFSRLNSNYALNYNENGNNTSSSNAILSIKTRDSRELSQSWVLEKATTGDNYDGKSIRFLDGNTSVDGAKLVYVGNNMYAIQKDGKNLEINRNQLTQVYDHKTNTVSEKVSSVYIHVTYSFKTPNYSFNNQKFMVKKLGSCYYICPSDIRNSGLTADGSSAWLNKTNSAQKCNVY